MKFFYYAIITLSITLTFCTDSINEAEYKSFDLSDTLTIHYNQTFSNSKEDISIKFASLVGDSRCPIDVMCVWEGDAELKFSFKKNSEVVEFSLHSAKNYFNSDTLVFGYHIEMIDVLPYPETTVQHKPEDYSAKIKISKP